MFVGHFGVGLSGKAVAPRVSLGTWFAACQFLDLLWPFFLLLDVEHVRVTPGYTRMSPLDFYDYPVTHSLFGAVLWSAAFALAWSIARRRSVPRPERRRTALLLGAVVLSHWVLDAVVHRPDLPVLPTMGPYVGLGLWNVPAAEIPVELAIFGLGIVLYLRATRARDGIGRFGFWALVAVLAAAWLGSIFGPPPEDEGVIGWAALATWLFVPWAAWVDRHRTSPPERGNVGTP